MSSHILSIFYGSGVQTYALPTVGPSLPVEGTRVTGMTLPGVAGAAGTPAVTVLPSVPGVFADHFLFDFYYRIWVVPQQITAQNPVIGTPIPFAIWNAYPQPKTNALDAILDVAGEGLEFDFDVGDTWKAIEYREVGITITPAAPIEIDAEFTFDFALGAEKFYFKATIADFVQMVPDPPVEETWEWLTDIIEAWDGTEQRIALRPTPRRSIQYSFLLEDEAERRRQYNRWFKSLATRIVLPYYQYATALTAGAVPGDTKVYFDPARTDLRDGEFALVYDPVSESGYLIKLDAVEADGATLDAPLTYTLTTAMIVSPAFTSRLRDRTGLSMKQVTGGITVQAEALNSRALFSRPGSTAVITMFDGLPVLDRRAIAEGDTPEVFEANYEVVDGEAGIQSIFTSWPHTEVATTRKYTIRRLQDPGEMDWWRDFLDYAKGRQNPFLMPTWFADLVPATAPANGATSMIVEGTEYANGKAEFNSFSRLQLETDAGIIYRKVLTTADNGDGTTTLNLDQPFGANPADVAISKVSFLNLVRLASDRIPLRHGGIRTQIELATRTVDQ